MRCQQVAGTGAPVRRMLRPARAGGRRSGRGTAAARGARVGLPASGAGAAEPPRACRCLQDVIPITVDDAALPEAISGVVLPSAAILNPKSKIQNGITPPESVQRLDKPAQGVYTLPDRSVKLRNILASFIY